MAVHIILAMDRYMKVRLRGKDHLCRGVMIPAGELHTVDTNGGTVLVFLYDSTTAVARQIREIRWVTDECCDEIARLYTDLLEKGVALRYADFEEGVLSSLSLEGTGGGVTDERIAAAMKHIRAVSSEGLSCREAAAAVHLSESRFSHLFKEQVGMSFSAYTIYQRLMRVYAGIFSGVSITQAALEAGFAGSSHFADVNRRVFGLSASGLTRDLTFVKVS